MFRMLRYVAILAAAVALQACDGARENGDSPALVADNRRIVADALAWERRQLPPAPGRYPAVHAPLALNG